MLLPVIKAGCKGMVRLIASSSGGYHIVYEVVSEMGAAECLYIKGDV
jgi:hypothetical protein